MSKPILWIVIPCYNEEQVLPITAPMFLQKITSLTEKGMISDKSRVLFVNDGSRDKTWELICGFAKQDAHFIGISQSRNRGHQNAVLAGLMEARANNCDITISIDCDGQDDINAMDEMVQKYLDGAEVVYGVRSRRDTDTFFKRFTAEGFYHLMNALGADIVFNHADYRLISARVLDSFADYKEVNIFLRGMVPLVGYDTSTVNSLRLWSARAPKRIDLSDFNHGHYVQASEEKELAEAISNILYPEDNHYEGKLLRLKQQYFFTSATLQYILKDFKKLNGTNWSKLPEKVVIHINDTHPGLAIPELMRLLMDEEGLGWDEAQQIVSRTMAYTNHTIMAEALEKWPEDMVKSLLPRIYQILVEMNKRLCARLWNFFPGEAERVGRMAIIAYGYIHMANLCVAMTFSTNGVSKLHGDILKQETFHDFYLVMPEKFSAITNGITHRRWLMACNPELTKLICDTIGTDWVKDPELLHDLAPYADDAAFREQFEKIKHNNKVRLSNFLKEHQGAIVDPNFIFDAQSKRLHEYKRQMLNALHILVLYNRIVNDPNFTMRPRVFIFGSKAAPGYNRAKLIIRFINGLSALIAKHPRASKMLQVVFLENYDVSSAQLLIPATEISEQISTASKEASGTGNMKYMMNGAITIGTMDGANVEIFEQVGMDNIYIFGMRSDTVLDMYRERNYNPMTIFETNQELRLALTQMIDGTVLPDAPSALQDLYHSLLIGDWGNMADPFFVLKDFGSYSMAQRRIDADYADRDKWNRMAVINTAMSGVFCSDRTIREYNDTIWHLDPLKRKV